MDKAKLERYAELKNNIKILEAEAAAMQPEIIEMMGENEQVESDFGTFSIGKRRQWKYNETIERVREDLKTMEKTAQQTGEAEYTEKSYLLFKGPADQL